MRWIRQDVVRVAVLVAVAVSAAATVLPVCARAQADAPRGAALIDSLAQAVEV